MPESCFCREQITGLILAGGQGRRMGGADKGLLDWRGQPLIAHGLTALASQVGGMLISANRHLERYQAFGWPVISDELPDFAGPLAGIASALAVCPTPYLLIAPCDVPDLPGDLAWRLWQAMQRENLPMAMARDAERSQPLLALWQTHLLPALSAYLHSGGRRVLAFQTAQGCALADFPERIFANFNAPPALRAATD